VLVPIGAVLCALALFAIAAPLSRGRAVVRIGAILAVATGPVALLPDEPSGSANAGTSTSVRLQGQRFALVGVDGAHWRPATSWT